MEKEKYIDTLLAFYKSEIDEKEFMKYLNSEIEMQNIFNKSLKFLLSSSDTSVINRMNETFNNIGTTKESFFKNNNKSMNVWELHFYVKQLLAKKYFNFLDKKDAVKYVLLKIESGWLDNANGEVEDFIKNKILVDIPQFKKANEAIKYAKSKVKELFACESKMPYWVQGCEWAFDKNGNPMKFVSQKRNGEKVEYLFVDQRTNEEKVIVQYY